MGAWPRSLAHDTATDASLSVPPLVAASVLDAVRWQQWNGAMSWEDDAFDYRERMAAIQQRLIEEDRQRWPESPALVNLSTLPDAKKRALWGRMKQRQPRLAAVMRDAAVQEMQALFGAKVHLPRDLVKELLDGE